MSPFVSMSSAGTHWLQHRRSGRVDLHLRSCLVYVYTMGGHESGLVQQLMRNTQYCTHQAELRSPKQIPKYPPTTQSRMRERHETPVLKEERQKEVYKRSKLLLERNLPIPIHTRPLIPHTRIPLMPIPPIYSAPLACTPSSFASIHENTRNA
jgi:hypothetical protein